MNLERMAFVARELQTDPKVSEGRLVSMLHGLDPDAVDALKSIRGVRDIAGGLLPYLMRAPKSDGIDWCYWD